MEKAPDAFRTISEVSEWLDTPTYVLRFWESRFPQIKPVKRAGGRRYYRPEDMALLGGIKKLLHFEGHTIKSVQNIIREKGARHVADMSPDLNQKVVSPPSAEAEPEIDLASLAAAQEKQERQKRRRERLARQKLKAEQKVKADAEKFKESPPEAEAKPEAVAPPEAPAKAREPKVTVTVHKKAKPAKSDAKPQPEAAPKDAKEKPLAIKIPTDRLLPGPFAIRAARQYEPEELRQIETLYYSLKMVRNNMKRAHADR